VNFPSYPNAILRVLQSSYEGATNFVVLNNAVSASSGNLVSVTQCQQIEFQDPEDGISVTVSGLPCPLSLASTSLSNVTVTGNPAAFQRYPVQIAGDAYFVTVALPVSKVSVDSASIMAGNQPNLVNVQLPGDTVSNVFVTTDSSADSTVSILGSPPQRITSIRTGSGDDTFVVPDLTKLTGTTIIDGAAGTNSINNSIHVGSNGEMIVATPYSLLQQTDSSLHILNWFNIQEQSFYIHGSSGNSAQFILQAPNDETLIQVFSVGVKGSTIIHYITGCGGKAEIRLFLNDTGEHIIYLGQNQKISNFRCTVRVIADGDTSLVSTIFVQASAETSALQWEFQTESLRVWDPQNPTSTSFLLFFSQINRAVFQFGSAGTQLDVMEGTIPTEYVFSFPPAKSGQSSNNFVNIRSTTNSILVNGSYVLTVGPEPSPFDSVNPLSSVFGMIAAAGDRAMSNQIILNSGTGPKAPAQNFLMDNHCLDLVNPDGTIPPLQHKPTSWMCQLLRDNGFLPSICPMGCHVSYLPNNFLSLSTGSAKDTFNASNVAIPVSVSLGDSADLIFWNCANVNASLDVGVGKDQIYILAPTSTLELFLGQDTDTDLVVIYANGYKPAINGNVVAPLGNNSYDMAILNQYFSNDLLSIKN
jgi:hypothetical protein